MSKSQEASWPESYPSRGSLVKIEDFRLKPWNRVVNLLPGTCNREAIRGKYNPVERYDTDRRHLNGSRGDPSGAGFQKDATAVDGGAFCRYQANLTPNNRLFFVCHIAAVQVGLVLKIRWTETAFNSPGHVAGDGSEATVAICQRMRCKVNIFARNRDHSHPPSAVGRSAVTPIQRRSYVELHAARWPVLAHLCKQG